MHPATRSTPARIGFCLATLALTSCATTVTLPPLPDCHPANAAAPSAERARPSGLLDPSAPVPTAEPEAMEGHEHHGHGVPEGAPMGEERGEEAGDVMPPPEEEAPLEPGDPPSHEHREMPEEEPTEPPAVLYACPMHPEVRSETPGSCRICGMGLEEIEPPTEDREPGGHAHEPPRGDGR